MIIRLLIGLALFLAVLLGPLPYRLSLMQNADDTRDQKLAKQEFYLRKAIAQTQLQPMSSPARQKALSDYAQLAWQKLNYAEAAKVYKALITNANPQKGKYDAKFAGYLIDMANLSRDQNDYANAKSYLESVLHYDGDELSKDDPRIARDLNNLGLQLYLEACTKDDRTERAKLMDTANEKLEAALAIYSLAINSKDSRNEQSLASTLDNQYLVLRDLGEDDQSKAVKARADEIQAKLHRVCQAP